MRPARPCARRQRPRPPPAPAAPTHSESAEPTGRHTSSPLRLFGLLAFIIIVLILNWTALDRATQQAVMLSLFYPATLAVALVLLFDKASRSWSVKSAGESVREWMFCDAIVLLLILGYLNLRRFVPGHDALSRGSRAATYNQSAVPQKINSANA